MDAILHIYYKNNDVILNTKQIKACYGLTQLITWNVFSKSLVLDYFDIIVARSP